MILIESIKYYETDQDPCTIAQYTPPYAGVPVLTAEGEQVVPCEVLTELCRGRRYRRANGEEYVIGMTADVQDLLGLQFDIYDSMVIESEEAHLKIMGMIKAQWRIKEAGFWTRLKWLFTGVK